MLQSDTDDMAERLGNLAFDLPEDAQLYLLLDASRSPDIHVYLDAFPDPAVCLFGGNLGEDTGAVAPWLAAPSRYGDMFDWFAEDGWGHDWGVLIQSRLPMPRLKAHLKKFLMVQLESGQRHFFKFYRPRHLASFLPLFEPANLAHFMRGIDGYLSEMPNNPDMALIHRLDQTGNLTTQQVALQPKDAPSG